MHINAIGDWHEIRLSLAELAVLQIISLQLCAAADRRQNGDYMLERKRHDTIMKIIERDGAVSASRLSRELSVSAETVRRDLVKLEVRGALTRVHGGAVKNGGVSAYTPLEKRLEEGTLGKASLARRALEYIEEGDVIAIDTGSTALALATAIKENFTRLTVITHCLNVFNTLKDLPDISLILCAGEYLKTENAFCGHLTTHALRELHVKKAFIFPTAVSMKFGIMDISAQLLPVQKQLIDSADEIFVLADSRKFEKKALFKLDDMKDNFKYITDSELSPELCAIYRENGYTVIMGARG